MLLFNAPSPGQLKEYINHRRPVSHSRTSSAISVPSLTSMATVSTTDSRSSLLAKYQPSLPLVESDNFNKKNHVPLRNNNDICNNFRAEENIHSVNHIDVTMGSSPVMSHKPTIHQRLNFTRRGWSSFFKQ
ncbi:Pcl9p [Saccharomyces cerevisiae AWRI796]|nr:Pcl9p [Saccharomyces cerevisiae AWRI796]